MLFNRVMRTRRTLNGGITEGVEAISYAEDSDHAALLGYV